MRTQLIDYTNMTEEQFLSWLDTESQRIREDNKIIPLRGYYKRLSKVSADIVKEKKYSFQKSIAESK
jgi:hypothetical protein